ncbi:MAG TPA: glycosyltransferase family 4 protein [Elusimicrobiota bacterium]|nr:glycosyltransferase family 4 protein [Elusimicrobiota bacterium]
MKPRIMIYSDCLVFGGSDAVAASILNDEGVRRFADATYCYRDHPRFAEGVAKRVASEVARWPVRLPERHDWLSETTPTPMRIVYRLAEYGVFLYDVGRLTAAFRSIRADLAHINNGGYPGAMGCRAAALAAKLAGMRRVVFVVHNQAIPLWMPWQLGDWIIDRLVSACVDVFVTATRTSQDALVRRGFPRSKMRIIQDGVPAAGPRRPAAEVRAELGLPTSAPVFVMTAFFESRKGHRELVEALARLGPDAPHVLLVGDGPEQERVVRQARACGLERRVHFAGFRSDYLDLIAACDVLVLPSLADEDMPLVILDAMALGKPVISSRLAGIPEEVSDGETGILVEPGDVAGLSAAVSRMAGDSGLRESFGRAGLRRFRELFEISLLGGRYRDLYKETLSTR